MHRNCVPSFLDPAPLPPDDDDDDGDEEERFAERTCVRTETARTCPLRSSARLSRTSLGELIFFCREKRESQYPKKMSRFKNNTNALKFFGLQSRPIIIILFCVFSDFLIWLDF